jgi:hypothetical protein
MFPDTLHLALKKKTAIESKSRQVCVNGCMLFEDDDVETVICKNPSCQENRFDDEGKPRRFMKMLSIGEQVSRMLANDETRQMMRYRHNYESIEGVYKDYFDGAAYKVFSQGSGQIFTGKDDVAMVLFVDGFRTSKANKGDKLTIIHLLNMNIPPEYRYQDAYMVQLAILPGPNNPKYIDTFLKPIVDEFYDLSTKGLIVKKDGVEICRARVHLVMATGDLPASAELAHHDGHMATFGCRICRIKTERHDHHTCFLTLDNEIRSSNDFKDPNEMNVSTIPKQCYSSTHQTSFIFFLPYSIIM